MQSNRVTDSSRTRTEVLNLLRVERASGQAAHSRPTSDPVVRIRKLRDLSGNSVPPLQGWIHFGRETQGVALGYHVAPRWG